MATTAPVRQPRATRRSGAIFLASSAMVGGGNYLFNVVMGRALGPAPFSDLLVILTLLLVVTLVSGTLQTAAAKLATESAGEAAQVWMRRRAFGAGAVLAIVLILGSTALADFFNVRSPLPIIIFSIGLPALLAQASDRGFLQGAVAFGRLSLSYQAEMWSRLGGAVALVWAGLGVGGAATALTLSFWISWAVARPRPLAGTRAIRPQVAAVAGSAALLAAGEVLINHGDLLLVKHFSDPTVAGAFGAIAVVGRIPFFAAWSLAGLAFPHVAAGSRRARHLTLATVAILGTGVSGAAWALPSLVELIFGDGFSAFASQLGPYTATAALFALARTSAFLELAEGRHRGARLVLIAGVAQTAVLWTLGGADIGAVVTVRLVVVMVLGLALVAGARR